MRRRRSWLLLLGFVLLASGCSNPAVEKAMRASFYGDAWKAPSGFEELRYEFHYSPPALESTPESYDLSHWVATNLEPDQIFAALTAAAPAGTAAKRGTASYPPTPFLQLCANNAGVSVGLDDLTGRYYGGRAPSELDGVARAKGYRYLLRFSVFRNPLAPC